MSTHAWLRPARTSRSAFGKLLQCEAKVAWRVPIGLISGVAVPVFVLIIFFAGLWVPREVMTPVLRDIGDWTPLGAAVQALQTSMQGSFPSAQPLLVMAAYALLFGFLAVRYFRWE